jgi:hypothetical protein
MSFCGKNMKMGKRKNEKCKEKGKKVKKVQRKK